MITGIVSFSLLLLGVGALGGYAWDKKMGGYKRWTTKWSVLPQREQGA
jgi:hypothetical protein